MEKQKLPNGIAVLILGIASILGNVVKNSW